MISAAIFLRSLMLVGLLSGTSAAPAQLKGSEYHETLGGKEDVEQD
jgi:hypothetical protein